MWQWCGRHLEKFSTIFKASSGLVKIWPDMHITGAVASVLVASKTTWDYVFGAFPFLSAGDFFVLSTWTTIFGGKLEDCIRWRHINFELYQVHDVNLIYRIKHGRMRLARIPKERQINTIFSIDPGKGLRRRPCIGFLLLRKTLNVPGNWKRLAQD